MIIPLTIDLQEVTESFSLSKDEVDSILDKAVKDVAANFAKKWESVALRDLNSTRQRYVSNLKVIDEGRAKGAVLLDYSKDPLIRMLEEGASAFDMKLYFAKSSKKKTKEDGGWYLTIPFSFGTPGSLKEKFSNIMPTEVYKIIKTKEHKESIKKDEVPDQYKTPTTRKKIDIPKSKTFEEYERKSSIYEGITKYTDKTTGQNSYSSFRRVSDNSDENSWIHPGFERKNLAEKALDEFENTFQTIMSDAIDNALFTLGYE